MPGNTRRKKAAESLRKAFKTPEEVPHTRLDEEQAPKSLSETIIDALKRKKKKAGG